MRSRTILFVLLIGMMFPEEKAAASGSREYTIAVEGLQRSYLIYRPNYLKEDSRVPLVIVLHGGFGTGAQAEKSYGWDEAADKHGFVVAYPDGMNRSWNAGGICCGKAMKNRVDDLSFITEVIRETMQKEHIDPRRVYLTGISNGAALSYRYACEGSYPIAAIGAVAGSFAYECKKPHAISVMEIHGVEDGNIPLSGGIGSKGVTQVPWLPVKETIAKFKQADGCKDKAPLQDGTVHTYPASCPVGRDVTLITIDDAGHQWPGGKKPGLFARSVLPLDLPSQALDATSVLWDFFNAHPAQ